MSEREKRAAQLAEKKRQLEELKAKKAETAASSSLAAAGTASSLPSTSSPSPKPVVNVDDLVTNLLSAPVPGAVSTPTPLPDAASPPTPAASSKPPLQVSYQLAEVTITPKIAETYSKQTQTDSATSPAAPSSPSATSRDRGKSALNIAASHDSQPTATGLVPSTPASPKSKVLSEEKIEEIVSTVDFGKWLDASSRIVERMLGSNNAFDVMIEYDGEEEKGDDVTEKTKLTHTFVSQRWTEHRTVTSISWSLHHKELMLVSYSKNNDSNDTRGGTGSGDEVYDGVVAVWSLNMLSRPEYVFTCQSQVLTSCFNRFDAQKVVGATYSGQIVVWDMRSKSSPVYRTSLTAAAHTHPVFSLCIVGTIHAHSIVSAGNDGRLSLWNPSNLNEPTTTLDLVYTNPKSEGKKEDVSVTCMDFAYNETNQLIVGTESGDLFAVSIHGSKTGVVSKYSSHYGPITGLHFHPTRASGMGSLGHLLLTSSVDFTVKLWNSRINAEPIYTFTTGTECIYDVAWSPIHPALFATVDGQGFLDLWNVNKDLEAPILRVEVSERALNRVSWSLDGNKVTVGDSKGSVFVYDVLPEIAAPLADEAEVLEERLQALSEEITVS